jgi:hypothetical protein
MACKTQFSAFCIKKVVIFCGMRRMAGKAPLFTIYRRMVNRYLFAFLLVAIKTEGINGLENKLRVF